MKSNYWLMRDAIFDREVKIAETAIAKRYRQLFSSTSGQLRELYDEIENPDGLKLASDIYQYNKYYQLLNSLQHNLLSIGSKEISTIEKSMVQLYKTTSQLVADEIGYNFISNEERVIKVMKSQWCGDGKIYSDRIWGKTSLLQERLMDELTAALIRGDSVDVVAGRLEREFEVSFNQSKRLVRTELTHIQNISAADVYQEAGYEYYRYYAVSDDKICGDCEELNGKIFRFTDAEAGDNFPPIHPNCRCGILAADKPE